MNEAHSLGENGIYEIRNNTHTDKKLNKTYDVHSDDKLCEIFNLSKVLY